MSVSADLGQVTAKTGHFSDHWGVSKRSPSRVRRRERRTAERDTAAATEKVAGEKAATEADAGKVAVKVAVKASTVEVAAENFSAERVATEEVATEKVAAENVAVKKVAAGRVTAEKFANKKVAAAKIAAEKAASEKEAAQKHAAEASTSCRGSVHQVPLPCVSGALKVDNAVEEEPVVLKVEEGSLMQICRNCHGTISADHKCADTKSPVSVVEEKPPPLPLCHYCCHRGSGKDPVHYFLQCVCPDWPCTCWCYCTDAQIEHKKLVYPAGFGLPGYKVKTVSAEDRPKARALAEARTGKARPCDNPSCMREFEEDNARALGQL